MTKIKLSNLIVGCTLQFYQVLFSQKHFEMKITLDRKASGGPASVSACSNMAIGLTRGPGTAVSEIGGRHGRVLVDVAVVLVVSRCTTTTWPRPRPGGQVEVVRG